MRNLVIMAAVAFMAATGGYFLAMSLDPAPQSTAISPFTTGPVQSDRLVGVRRPGFNLTDLDGNRVSADDFDGQAWLVNFWATWCSPCVEEMPMLNGLHEKFRARGLNVVGIAVDDPEKARAFAADLSIGYPILVGLTDTALVAREFGNRGGMLPYTVLVDAQGTIRWTHLGALVEEDLERQINQLN